MKLRYLNSSFNEAQNVDCESIFRTKSHMKLCSDILSEPLDKYALGYCIANSNSRMFWNVDIKYGSADSFKWGLKTCIPCGGMIENLCIDGCSINIDDLYSYPLHGIKSLELSGCKLKNSDMVHLSKIIPIMTNLEELNIQCNPCTEGGEDGLLKVLQQLSYSNVTRLQISSTGPCELLHVTDYCSVMTQLIDPSSGKLKELCAGNFGEYFGNYFDYQSLIDLTSPLSSLKTLALFLPQLNLCSGLETNTCLTKLEIHTLNLHPYDDIDTLSSDSSPSEIDIPYSPDLSPIVKILEQNKTLQNLTFGFFELPKNDTKLRDIVKELNKNTTLQHIKLDIITSERMSTDTLSFMKANYPELTLDPRISWNNLYY